ncbi:MAG: twitching motility protein [Frankiales bacterium]|nr:twitching motility protein [Frankiales bacterium]
MDQHGNLGSDEPASSPLDPSWTPAPQLTPTHALDMAQPTFAFAAPAEAPPAEPAALASAFTILPGAEPAPAVAAPAPVAHVAVAPVAVQHVPAAPIAVAPLVAPVAVPVQVEPVAQSPAPVVAEAMPAAPPVAEAMPAAPPIAEPMPTSPPAPSAEPVSLEDAASELSALSAPEEALAVRVGAEDTSEDSMFLTDLLIEVLNRGCSDLHLTVGAPPTVRQHGSLTPIDDRPKLTPQFLQKVIYAILSQKQREKFEEVLELDFAYSVPGRARFRVNVYRQRDALGAAFRLIPYEIKALEDLGVPPTVSNFAMLPRGFVLVTGPTGSGKSTTLAAVVDMANRQRRDHIMSVEDPIEFLHED